MDLSTVQPNEIVMAEFVPETFWTRLDERLERWGERLNPILVKETRQALKSRQFTITFVMLLLACLLWSLIGVAAIGPEIYYLPSGSTLFQGYYLILCLPLSIIVPFSAFRSLIKEQEDNTYELLSISTLSPRQIVTGKLGSAMIQIIVYYSAVAPCLGFSYLLRGLDLISIVLLMVYAFLGSLALSALGILAATLAKQKMMQVLMSVCLMAGLFVVFYGWCEATDEILRWGIGDFGDDHFWPVHVMLANLYFTSLLIVTWAATARLNFPGENGSTPLRLLMLIQQCCFVGWCSIGVTLQSGMLPGLVCLAAVYWWGMGCFFSGESPDLSLRVKRRLPQSVLGRSLLTWFFPGPGKGYVFAVANLTAMMLLAALVIHFADYVIPHYIVSYRSAIWNPKAAVFTALVCLVSHIAAYLGVGGILITLMRRRWSMNMLFCVILQVCLMGIGIGVPMIIQMMTPSLRGFNYTLLQITNPVWTFIHLLTGLPQHANQLLFIVPSVGLFVFLLYGFLQVVEELRQVRILAPARVLEEEALLHPEPEPLPLSPWD